MIKRRPSPAAAETRIEAQRSGFDSEAQKRRSELHMPETAWGGIWSPLRANDVEKELDLH